ncbi:MAG: glucose 1-dehydrogenase [Oscillibacter sp.]|jgi:NAD(P)-dependent dehydrogenase (short-subunit alcohol dehydrogenase family)|nr:glucose 1-dehydrogenase [Oscillibacter sp.]
MEFPTFDLKGKTALVTGATRSIGKALALGLANAGADVVVVGRTKDACANTAEEIRAMGRRALAVPADVTDQAAVEAMVEQAEVAFGRIDILINNAGAAVTRAAEDVTMEEWDRVVNVDLRGAFMVAQAVGRVMIRQRSGRIINTVSVYGYTGGKLVIPYAAAKGGLAMVTKSLALEWARYNINVNALVPGYIVTEINQKEFENEKVYNSIVRKIPLRRLGRVEDIIGSVVYLASDASNYVTGAVIAADGGWLAE